jgi:hypothetical protein
MSKQAYRFSFFRAGGVDQVVLSSGEDLNHLDELDQKLWVALSCPTRGLEFDTRTLDLIDADGDGHIRPNEILDSVRFARDVLRNLDKLFKGEGKIALADIKDSTDLGKEILAEVKHILGVLGRPDADTISLDDIADTAKILAATRFNGDGILPPESAGEPAAEQVVRDMVATVGSKPDASGKAGVDQALVDKFFDDATSVVAWLDQGDKDDVARAAGEGTGAAAAAVAAVKAKVDDYFARCRLAAFDPRASVMLNPAEAELVALGPKVLTADAEDIAKLPLAAVGANKPLPLVDGLNPAWGARIATLAGAAVHPMLGADKITLSESEWSGIQDRLAPYVAWQAKKPDTPVASLPAARVRELLTGDLRKRIADLIAQDTAGGDRNRKITQVEKMLRLHRDLVPLLRNFVNFSQFYGTRKSIFQVGTLFIDGRSVDLCLPVDDTGKHASLAGLARAYLLYCDCTRQSGEKRSIVAAVTGGSTDNLMAGRNGVFCDRKGRDWDATVTRIVENPISIRQAFWSPYKHLVRMLEEQVAKRAVAAEQESKQKVQVVATDAAHADKAKSPKTPATDKKPEAKKMDVGTVAAIGVAVAGVATFLSSMLAMFFGLGLWMPVGLLGLMLAISGPSMLIAWLKLRQRNIGPILDANGWSVNAFAKINVAFGGALTQVATLPRGSRRELHDPFADKRRPWKLYLLLLFLLTLAGLWYTGRLDEHLPEHLRAAEILGGELPGSAAPPPASTPSPETAPAQAQ